jgi:hypothetical protein
MYGEPINVSDFTDYTNKYNSATILKKREQESRTDVAATWTNQKNSTYIKCVSRT